MTDVKYAEWECAFLGNIQENCVRTPDPQRAAELAITASLLFLALNCEPSDFCTALNRIFGETDTLKQAAIDGSSVVKLDVLRRKRKLPLDS